MAFGASVSTGSSLSHAPEPGTCPPSPPELALASVLCGSGPAAAHTFVYTGTFSAEVSGGMGTGSALVTIDSDLFTMRVQADFSAARPRRPRLSRAQADRSL